MGYWSTTLSGQSLQLFGDLNPDNSEMLWGDYPADMIDAGLENLIARLTAELGRYPSLAEVDAVKSTAPEMVAAIAEARKAFESDIERPATDGEIAAGLAFSDTEISLDCFIRRDIHVGDRVSWAVMRDTGAWKEIDYLAEGEVIAVEVRAMTSSWGTWEKTFLTVRREDSIDEIEKAYASKVLPGDPTVAERNAEREARKNKSWEL